MDTTLIRELIKQFLDDNGELKNRLLADKERRSRRAAEYLTTERIPNLTEDELRELFEDTDSWRGTRGKKQFWGWVAGESGGLLQEARDWLLDLIETAERGISESEFERLCEAKKGVGRSYLSELLALRFPDRYWVTNSQTGEFLQAVGADLPPKYKAGARYMAEGRYIGEVRRILSEEAGREVDYLFTDAFIYWVVENELVKTAKPSKSDGDIFKGFPDDAFKFFQELADNNNEQWFKANRRRFEESVKKPLESLLKSVAPVMRELDPSLETEVKYPNVMGRLRRRRGADKEEPYNLWFWGAFHRSEVPKLEDALLSVEVNGEGVVVSLKIAGSKGDRVLERFKSNVQNYGDLFATLLMNAPKCSLSTDADSPEYSYLLPLPLDHAPRHDLIKAILNANHIAFTRGYAPLNVIEQLATEFEESPDFALFKYMVPTMSFEEFANKMGLYRIPDDPSEFSKEVAQFLKDLYPLFAFATSENPPETLENLKIDISSPTYYTIAELCTETFTDRAFWENAEALLKDKGQVVFYGPPGTGKTFVAKCFARYVAGSPDRVETVQFHPSYSYEDFIEGIRPQTTDNGTLSYEVRPGIFKNLCKTAAHDPDHPYVLIIDEINRGQLPRIFGELLYLLEYRNEYVRLQYSGEQFRIPPNLYIIGTMNTADRSIALVDHALRRRFHFIPMEASPDILRSYLRAKGLNDMLWVADLLSNLNRQLAADGISWHLHIGHSHFMKDDLDRDSARMIWEYSIRPTLEEYFYQQPDALENYEFNKLAGGTGNGG